MEPGVPLFGQVQFIDSICNLYTREKGYIFYRTQPTVEVQEAWGELVSKQKEEKLK